jgi:hypothetical protein
MLLSAVVVMSSKKLAAFAIVTAALVAMALAIAPAFRISASAKI